MCIFDAQIAELIGIDWKNGKEEKVTGVTGKSESYFVHPVSIEVGGYKYNINAGFKPEYPWSYSLVGQIGFFSLFVVTFDYRKSELILKPKLDLN